MGELTFLSDSEVTLGDLGGDRSAGSGSGDRFGDLERGPGRLFFKKIARVQRRRADVRIAASLVRFAWDGVGGADGPFFSADSQSSGSLIFVGVALIASGRASETRALQGGTQNLLK